jgi:hypothetical protein
MYTGCNEIRNIGELMQGSLSRNDGRVISCLSREVTSLSETVCARLMCTHCVGPTNCIGQKLAMIEVKMVVALMVRELDVELCEDQSFREFHSISMGFKEGLFADIKRREL